MAVGTIILLLMAAPSPLTLREALSLPPEQVGDRALADWQHGKIVTVVREPDRMKPPGTVEVRMQEAPLAISQGCVRNGWVVTFAHDAATPEANAVVKSGYARPEVLLTRSAQCPDSGYVRVGTTLSAPVALAALRTLEDVVRRKTKRQIICRNETPTNLCKNDRTTFREMSAISPWLVTNQSGPIEIWLGTPGQMITIVTFDKATNGALRITRKIPAPF